MAGANLRELMDRMGHSTTRAALIYLQATHEQQAAPDAATSWRAKVWVGLATDYGRANLARTSHDQPGDTR
jgi:hypothetical protein